MSVTITGHNLLKMGHNKRHVTISEVIISDFVIRILYENQTSV